MAYDHVNAAWPAGTNEGRDLKPTPQEAVSAVKRLYRFALKRKCPYRVVATSGRRRGGIRRGVWKINPDRWGGGWHEVVHHVSHLCAWRLHPGIKTHSTQHAFLEKEMISYVVRSGWLEGKLKRPEKPATDKTALRHQRMLANLQRWQRKQRRAENAVRKLTRALARVEKMAHTITIEG